LLQEELKFLKKKMGGEGLEPSIIELLHGSSFIVIPFGRFILKRGLEPNIIASELLKSSELATGRTTLGINEITIQS
jgi:hypothetical protein